MKTTGGPALGASVSSPALTNSAVSLLRDNLNEQERQLWTSLGPNWTFPRSVLFPILLSSWTLGLFKAIKWPKIRVKMFCYGSKPSLKFERQNVRSGMSL